MSGRKSGIKLLFEREVVVKELELMAQRGAIPRGLQLQIQRFHELKLLKREHRELTHKLHKAAEEQDMSLTSIERSYDVRVRLCLALAFALMLSVLAMNRCLLAAPTHRYCDSTSTYVSGSADECVSCPAHAECAFGAATCSDKAFRLYAADNSCFPSAQFRERIDADKLYAVVAEELAQRARRSLVRCADDDSAARAMSVSEMASFLRAKAKQLGMAPPARLEPAMARLFRRMRIDGYYGNVVAQEHGLFAARLPQPQEAAAHNCAKLNALLLAKTYGLELGVAVLCGTALLLTWRATA